MLYVSKQKGAPGHWQGVPGPGSCPSRLETLSTCGQVQHYACQGKGVTSNGQHVDLQGRKLYVIFDTGTTGLTVKQSCDDTCLCGLLLLVRLAWDFDSADVMLAQVTRDLYDSVLQEYQGRLFQAIADSRALRRRREESTVQGSKEGAAGVAPATPAKVQRPWR